MKRAIGILGGTFDPIHNGHLLPAQHAMQQLQMADCACCPTTFHPIDPSSGPAAHSVWPWPSWQPAACPVFGWMIESSNVATPSYTIDTLIELRRELPDTPLCFLIGMDSLLGPSRWHRWQELTDYAHLVVSVSPGWQPDFSPEIQQFLARHSCQDPLAVHGQLAGLLLLLDNDPIAISPPLLRQALRSGELSCRLVA